MQGYLDGAKCREMLRDPTHKFWRMWGETGFNYRQPGDQPCWSPKHSRTFWHETLDATQCDADWLHSSLDRPRGATVPLKDRVQLLRHQLGLPEAQTLAQTVAAAHAELGSVAEGRPLAQQVDALIGVLGVSVPAPFTAAAPALLGLDEDVATVCHSAAGGAVAAPSTGQERDEVVAAACVKGNLLRLPSDPSSATRRWNMCHNLQRLACATEGKLPGQAGDKAVRLATAPKALRVEPLNYHDGQNDEEDRRAYPVRNVFYLEVCLLNELCANRTALFTVDAGAKFECKLDKSRLNDLRILLQQLAGSQDDPLASTP
jgi:hypothetical protein